MRLLICSRIQISIRLIYDKLLFIRSPHILCFLLYLTFSFFLGAIFACGKNRAFRSSAFAPYFASQSTPSALLQSLVRVGSQERELFVQWFVFCIFISNIPRNTSPLFLLGLSVRPGLLHLTELQLLPSYCLSRRYFLLFQVQGFLLLYRLTLL